MKSRRDFLKLAAAAGAAWPLASCGSAQPKRETSGKGAASPGLMLNVEIVGGFAYVFDSNFTRLVLASVKQPGAGEPGEKCDFIDHPMALSVKSGVTIRTQIPPTQPDSHGNIYYMCPP